MNEFKTNQRTNMLRSITSAQTYLDLAKMTAKDLGDKKTAKALKKINEELLIIHDDVVSQSDPRRG